MHDVSENVNMLFGKHGDISWDGHISVKSNRAY